MSSKRPFLRIDELELSGKRLFLRLDLNVPMSSTQEITDETRILEALPTIQYALEKGARIVLASHLGRPKPDNPEDLKKYSMEPVAKRVAELLGVEIILIDSLRDTSVKSMLMNLKSGQLMCLENLRFDEGEESNSPQLAQVWAQFAEVYVNDAFGSSHRAHASLSALPSLVPQKGCGFLIDKELAALDRLVSSPSHPFALVLGGAKVSDKIKLIERLIDRVDMVLVGGAMAYTFLKAKQIPVGLSRTEDSQLAFCHQLAERLEARSKPLLLPVDHVTVKSFSTFEGLQHNEDQAIHGDVMGVDIGPRTLQLYTEALSSAKTVFWNGPMGVFERSGAEKGSLGLARYLGAMSSAYTVIGGGDSASAAEMAGVKGQITHVSTGGGASLEYLEGAGLPGLKVLAGAKRSEQ